MGSHKNLSITSTDLTFYFSICHNSKNMEFFNSIPSHMDYDGQQKAETWSRRIVVLSGLGLLDSTVFSDSLYSWSWFGFCSYVNRSSMADVQTETIELAKTKTRK